ncbi:MAG: hypothetical protein AAF490_14610 [Chloroflexota bacterium]
MSTVIWQIGSIAVLADGRAASRLIIMPLRSIALGESSIVGCSSTTAVSTF